MTFSPSPDVLGFGADMIGGCKYLWLQQHWTHHAFTNDHDRDPDSTVCTRVHVQDKIDFEHACVNVLW